MLLRGINGRWCVVLYPLPTFHSSLFTINYMVTKFPSESITVMTEMVMPNDTNTLNNLMGGNLMRWMDIAAGICSRRHSGCVCVTASVDSVAFHNPIRLGEIVTITAKVTRVFNTSMEIHIVVHAEGINPGTRRRCNEAFFTFVGLDEWDNKLSIPKIEPQTDEEKALYASAQRRRDMRLILAGRMKPNQSEELKAIFTNPNA